MLPVFILRLHIRKRKRETNPLAFPVLGDPQDVVVFHRRHSAISVGRLLSTVTNINCLLMVLIRRDSARNLLKFSGFSRALEVPKKR